MSPRTRVVVVGASIAGLLTARVLSDLVDEVVVLERERLPGMTDDVQGDDRAEAVARGHVPQGRHLHTLLGAGYERIDAWFPGIVDRLEAAGAERVDGTRAWVFQSGGYRAQGDWGGSTLSMTRPLLELCVRERVAALPNVRLVDGVTVKGVRVEDGRVVGVRTADGEWPADLVADCSGRSSRLAHDLEASGVLAPPVTEVGVDVAYASRFLERRDGDLDGQFTVCVADPREGFRVGAAMPVEGDRWQVTLGGMHGDVPPTADAGFLEFARSLPSPLVGGLVESCPPASPVLAYRFPSSRRRHLEKVDPLPGLVVVGDAACSFDPIYGQGMSSAAVQAEQLGAVLGRLLRGRSGEASVEVLRSAELPRRYHRRAARVVDVPWTIAVGGDFQHPATTGPRPRGSRALNAYVERVMRATHASVEVTRRLNEVLNLVAPATQLLAPGTVARVAVAARRSPVVTGRLEHPRVGRPAAVADTD